MHFYVAFISIKNTFYYRENYYIIYQKLINQNMNRLFNENAIVGRKYRSDPLISGISGPTPLMFPYSISARIWWKYSDSPIYAIIRSADFISIRTGSRQITEKSIWADFSFYHIFSCLIFFDDFFFNDQQIYLAFREKTLD